MRLKLGGIPSKARIAKTSIMANNIDNTVDIIYICGTALYLGFIIRFQSMAVLNIIHPLIKDTSRFKDNRPPPTIIVYSIIPIKDEMGEASPLSNHCLLVAVELFNSP